VTNIQKLVDGPSAVSEMTCLSKCFVGFHPLCIISVSSLKCINFARTNGFYHLRERLENTCPNEWARMQALMINTNLRRLSSMQISQPASLIQAFCAAKTQTRLNLLAVSNTL